MINLNELGIDENIQVGMGGEPGERIVQRNENEFEKEKEAQLIAQSVSEKFSKSLSEVRMKERSKLALYIVENSKYFTAEEVQTATELNKNIKAYQPETQLSNLVRAKVEDALAA